MDNSPGTSGKIQEDSMANFLESIETLLFIGRGRLACAYCGQCFNLTSVQTNGVLVQGARVPLVYKDFVCLSVCPCRLP